MELSKIVRGKTKRDHGSPKVVHGEEKVEGAVEVKVGGEQDVPQTVPAHVLADDGPEAADALVHAGLEPVRPGPGPGRVVAAELVVCALVVLVAVV